MYYSSRTPATFMYDSILALSLTVLTSHWTIPCHVACPAVPISTNSSLPTWTASRNWYPIRVDVCITTRNEVYLWRYFETSPLLSITDATLFMSNQILKRFIKNKNDFHQKFAKIEDFKVDHSKKLLNFQNRDLLYRKSYSKFDGF